LKLFKRGIRRELSKNEVFGTPLDVCSAVGFVKSGRMAFKRYLPNGKEIQIIRFLPGDMFGELLVLAEEHYRGWLIAEENSVVWTLNKETLEKLLQNRESRIFFFKAISLRVSQLTQTLTILSYKKVSERLAFFLLSEGGSINLKSVTDLSSKLNCSREAMSRTLLALEKSELISRRDGIIKVEDVIKLEEFI